MKSRGSLVAVGALVTVLLAAGVWFAPLPYLVQQPGPTVDVLGSEVITVTGAPTSVSAGKLLLTTVEVGDVDAAGALRTWLDDTNALIPREAVFTDGRSEEQVIESNQTAFEESENTAITTALAELGNPAGVTVGVDVKEIGGPSAGLMITLGIIDKLTPADLTGGRLIAGTGVIGPDGAVGPIGGITQKLHGARAAGATFFLVPADNCAEARRSPPPGLTTARVASLDDALLALQSIAAGAVPTAC